MTMRSYDVKDHEGHMMLDDHEGHMMLDAHWGPVMLEDHEGHMMLEDHDGHMCPLRKRFLCGGVDARRGQMQDFLR